MTASPSLAPQGTAHPPCIGVFDSGLGGLSVLRALRQQLPGVPLCYLADSAHAPYGGRSTEYLQDRSLRIGQFLIDQGATLLVVACNTATTQAVAALRGRWPTLPIVGVEPGIKPAAAATRTGRIGVLATSATVASARFAQLLKDFAGDKTVLAQACPGLVDEIERGPLDSPALQALVQRFCAPLVAADVDTVVLGCTHYPLLKPLFQQALGGQVLIVDTETAVARQAAKRWFETQAAAASSSPLLAADLRLYSSGEAQQLTDFVRHTLGWNELTAQHVEV